MLLLSCSSREVWRFFTSISVQMLSEDPALHNRIRGHLSLCLRISFPHLTFVSFLVLARGSASHSSSLLLSSVTVFVQVFLFCGLLCLLFCYFPVPLCLPGLLVVGLLPTRSPPFLSTRVSTFLEDHFALSLVALDIAILQNMPVPNMT